MEFLFSIPAIDERGRVIKIYFIFLNEKQRKGKEASERNRIVANELVISCDSSHSNTNLKFCLN